MKNSSASATRDVEMSISRLEEIAQVPVGLTNLDTPFATVDTGKPCSAPGELDFPFGLAITEATN